MPRKPYISDDNWHNEPDSKKRKQIQDRLAQRARPPVPSPTTSPPAPMTVFGALYINGRILGLTCSCSIPGRSLPVSMDIPPPLHPTEMQLTTIHARWIDRIPFPKMRDNMITLFSMLDDEEIIEDLFTIPSFAITPGCATWDPRAWKIEKPFAEKWGYLLF
ncbi:hypothetical protein K505DRAFT_353500 [Melanomma pulvis-pyrius CBS 109.77]|uniref:Uncharacterized protein n=1 Tax=Melanomma pulvis-pyrius CBS 109.77 TaxID=1314802 RepID=A0A6A6WVP7_9PLEO|nr:hypothetical protein K505DRAFT_353500 [Melanomma pulvis-pyrius CBS 109.77]